MPQAELTYSTYPHGVPHFAGGRRVVNMYAEKAEGQARAPFTLKSCPGMKVWSTPTGLSLFQPEFRGFHWFASTLYAVIGEDLVSFTSAGAATVEDTGIAGSGQVYMVSDNDEMIIVTGPGTTDYLWNGTTLSSITVTGNVLDWADVDLIDGRAVYVQASPTIPGRFSWSDANDLDTVTGSDQFANAESQTDALLRVKVINRVVWFFGENSLEPWFSTGGDPAFARRADALQPYGLGALNSIAELNGRGFFIAKSLGSQPHVRMITGLQTDRVSSNALDDFLSRNTYSDAIGFTYSKHGHDWYYLVFPSANRAFGYDASLGFNPPFWHEPQSGVNEIAGWNARHCIVAHDKVLVGHKNDGKIYELDADTHTDAGEKRLRMFTAELGSSGEFFNRLDNVVLDISTGLASLGSTVEPAVSMSLSRDGGQTWTDELPRGFGFAGDYDKEVGWGGQGSFRYGLAKFKVTDDVNVEVTKVHASGVPGRQVSG